MKKVYIVSKTHLDLGFTDYAQNVLEKYLTQYIPNAIKTANLVNADGKKRFVWTTGSWLLLKALEHDKSGLVKAALKEGNIAPHALPFTLHTELLDEQSLDYALEMVEQLDKITGTKTVAAKMTDVPGHTISLVPVLAKHGIKLLHIGVNGASAMPNVPPCFLWRHSSGAEVVVIYSASYGGAFECDLVDEILYFDHTVDNRGARNKEDTIKAFEKVEKLYPDYEVCAGRMDDYANAIWQVREKLPVVTSEIGDTWIHGVGTDPYKTGALKELIKIKNNLLAQNKIDTNSKEYKQLMENILCVAEHTWGGDSKVFLSDYCHYDKEGFAIARKSDNPILTQEVLDTEYGKDVVTKRETGEYNQGSYKALEKAWSEQREYITKAISCLPKDVDTSCISGLIPVEISKLDYNNKTEIFNDKIKLRTDKNGGIVIDYCGKKIFDSKGKAPISYMAFCGDDYDVWLKNYTRDFEDNHLWSLPDFCRPFLHKIDGLYDFGEYCPKLVGTFGDKNKLVLHFVSNDEHSKKLGCPQKFEIAFTILKEEIKICVKWINKEASRVPEATIFKLFPLNTTDVFVKKCGRAVNPFDIVEYGNRRLFAIEEFGFLSNDTRVKIENHHSPLAMAGFCNLVRFDKNYLDIGDGVSFVLHNSIWGTNFPLWYEDNAKFEFSIKFGE